MDSTEQTTDSVQPGRQRKQRRDTFRLVFIFILAQKITLPKCLFCKKNTFGKEIRCACRLFKAQSSGFQYKTVKKARSKLTFGIDEEENGTF